LASICCPQTPHYEFDLSIRQLPPLLNNRRVATLRKLAQNFACLRAGPIDRQPERLARKSVVRFAVVRHPLGNVTRSAGHVILQNATTAQYSGRQKRFVWKRQTLLPDIHRRGGIIENLLMTGKGGVSCEARGAGKVGYGNDRGVVAPTVVESKLIRPMELLLMRSNFALKTRSPGTEFLDAETGRQKSRPKSVNAGRDQN
jgi:hypothetical protein